MEREWEPQQHQGLARCSNDGNDHRHQDRTKVASATRAAARRHHNDGNGGTKKETSGGAGR